MTKTEYFVSILKQCLFYSHFVQNLDNNIYNSVQEYFLFTQPKMWFRCGFTWSESKQGYNYWKEISDNWYEFVSSKLTTPQKYLSKWYKLNLQSLISIY